MEASFWLDRWSNNQIGWHELSAEMWRHCGAHEMVWHLPRRI
jgi:hypothetical protein